MTGLGPRCKHCRALEKDLPTPACDVSKTGLHEFFAPEYDEIQRPPTLEEYEPNSIAWWTHRVDMTVLEAAQAGAEPLLAKATAMAQLHIAAALERIANALEQKNRRATYVPVARRPGEPIDQETRNHMERLPPTAAEYRLRDPRTARHAYGAYVGSCVCSLCGAGRLHEIHEGFPERRPAE